MALGRISALPPLGCVMCTIGISTAWKLRLKSKFRRANWRTPSSLLILTRVRTSLRESPFISKRYLVSSSSICAGFFSVSAVFEFADGDVCCVSELGAGLLVRVCEGESGATMRVGSKKQINGHRLKPVPRELFHAAVRLGTELAVNDPTQKV